MNPQGTGWILCHSDSQYNNQTFIEVITKMGFGSKGCRFESLSCPPKCNVDGPGSL